VERVAASRTEQGASGSRDPDRSAAYHHARLRIDEGMEIFATVFEKTATNVA
jgi:hypothetical protein